MRGSAHGGGACVPHFGVVTVSFALGCALLWNVILLNQKVACDLAAQRLRADATLSISALRLQNEQLKQAVVECDCNQYKDEVDKCLREKQSLLDLPPKVCPTAEPQHQVASPPPAAPVASEARIAVIVFCYNRPEYLERALTSILQYLPSSHALIVSQDGDERRVAELLAQPKYASRLLHVQHVKGRVDWKEKGKASLASYYFISSHYRFGLRLKYDAAIILEDDLEIAPDFFSYFAATLPLLNKDPSLYCVSAWNDNGNPEYINTQHYKELRRSDFFPGLGWLMTRRLWSELGSRWPDGFWDDWMRLREQRQERHCIYPEVSRTYTFGAQGASQGQFFKEHLSSIVLNKQPLDWANEDLSYLSLPNWDDAFEAELQRASKSIRHALELDTLSEQVVSLYYDNEANFKELATSLKIMADTKESIPRTAYRGVIKFHHGTNTVFLRPRSLPPRLKAS